MLQKRKPNRLKNFDYSKSGYYFITICTAKRKAIFSKIVGRPLAAADGICHNEIELTKIGKTAEKQLLNIEKRYDNIQIDKYIIMPNHIHLILRINNTAAVNSRPTVSNIIRAYKSLTTKECRAFYTGEIWQTSFYDHIIRDEKDYLRIWEYIDTNPQKWADDKYFAL